MMLERIQQKMEGPAMKVVLGIIIIFFVFAGYFGANLVTPGNESVANVDGVNITAAEIDNTITNMRRGNANFDQQYPTEASKAKLREDVRNQLINDRVFTNSINNAGLTASKDQVAKQIHSMPEFQLGGVYDSNTAKTIVAQSGHTDSSIYSYAKNQLVRDQFNQSIAETGFVTDKEIFAFYRMQEQTRDARVLTVPKSKFSDGIVIGDAETKTYYNDNQASFVQPEQVNIKYVLLSKDTLAQELKASVTDEQVAAFYNDENNNAEFVAPDQIAVSHILIANEVDDAESKAADLHAQIKAGGDFAELAKQHSSDTFSGAEGGALPATEAQVGNSGWVPEFETAALALTEKGQITDLVKTDFGFHIIKLNERTSGESKPISEVSEDIKQRIADGLAQTQFFTTKALLDEALFTTETMEDLANTASLTVMNSGFFDRSSVPSVINAPALVEQAFDPSNIESKEISDEINMGNQTIAYLMVNEHKPEGIKPLSEVDAEIVNLLTEEKINNNAKVYAEEIHKALEAGEAVDALLAEKQLVWVENNSFGSRDSSLNPELASVLFKQVAPTDGKPLRVVESLFSGDLAVIELNKVNYPDISSLDDAKIQQLKSILTNVNSRSDVSNLITELRERSEIQ